MMLMALGFVVMVVGARASDGGALVSPLWLVATYALHTFGELCVVADRPVDGDQARAAPSSCRC